MPRNKRLELNHVAPGVWFTTDKRFAVVRRLKPIKPLEVTADFKISKEFSIRSFVGYDGPREYPQLAPEVGVVETFREVFPWLGKYTGEGSFVAGDPGQTKPLAVGERRQNESVDVFADLVLTEEWALNKQWIAGIRKWWKGLVDKSKRFGDAEGKRSGQEAIRYLENMKAQLGALRRDLWLKKGLLPRSLTGKERQDRKVDRESGNPFRELKNNVAYDLEAAEDLVQDKLDRVKNWYDALYDEKSFAYRNYPGADEKRYGKNSDKDALGAELEGLPEDIQKVDKIVSGKVFRRLSAFVNKWNVDDVQDDPFEDQQTDIEYSVGRMKVVIHPVSFRGHRVATLARHPDSVLEPSDVKRFVKTVKAAESLLKRAGFSKVWYGAIDVVPSSHGYKFQGSKTGRSYRAAAVYNHGADSVQIMGIPDGQRQHELVLRTIIHELGHRWYYKFMNQPERLRFDAYFGDVDAVSPYGAENPAEDFAEVFEWYVMGKKLTRDQKERFKSFALKGGRVRRHESVFNMRDRLLKEGDSTVLRSRSYVFEAKGPTYAEAQKQVKDMLREHGWTVKDGLKVPHATKGDVRLWFKKQAVYASGAKQQLGAARSLNINLKKLTQFPAEKVARFLYRKGKELSDFLQSDY